METIERVGATLAILTPLILGLGAALRWWLEKYAAIRTADGQPVAVTQGQPVAQDPTFTGYLTTELENAVAERDAYRDALVRAGLNPKQALADAGITT